MTKEQMENILTKAKNLLRKTYHEGTSREWFAYNEWIELYTAIKEAEEPEWMGD